MLLLQETTRKNAPFVFAMSKGKKLLERIKRMAQHQCQH